MEIYKIIGLGIIAVFLSIILKQYRPEFAIFISIIFGVIIFVFVSEKITSVVSLLKDLGQKSQIDFEFIQIILKVTGIAYLTEFAINICKDLGETAIGLKLELAGKIIMIYLSIPIVLTFIETIINIF